MSHLFWMVLFVQAVTEVQPPVSPLTVAPGNNGTLACSFSASKTLNISNIIINWQFGEMVVHSFYLGKDQLERQATIYRGRTHLYKEELLKGNASLLLTDVRPEDEGEYSCHVNYEQGGTKEKLELIVAAPFNEPLLSLQPTCEGINITVTLFNGYPEPELRWYDSTGRQLDHTKPSVQLDNGGRYQVSSTLNFRSKTVETINVEIKLKDHQIITRELLLHPSPDHCQECCQMPPTPQNRIHFAVLFWFSVIIVFLLVLFIKKWK